MKVHARSLVALSLGAGACFLLSELAYNANLGRYENLDPAPFSKLTPLWGILALIVPGTVIAIVSEYRVPLLSAAAYVIGLESNFWHHFDEGDAHRSEYILDFFTRYWPKIVADLIAVAACGAIVGIVALMLVRRLKPVGINFLRRLSGE